MHPLRAVVINLACDTKGRIIENDTLQATDSLSQFLYNCIKLLTSAHMIFHPTYCHKVMYCLPLHFDPIGIILQVLHKKEGQVCIMYVFAQRQYFTRVMILYISKYSGNWN